MLSKLISTSAVVLLSASMATAQTSSLCNPVKGQKCPDDPAFGGVVDIDFRKGASEYFKLADGTDLNYDTTKGAEFVIAADTNAPTITSTKYLFFGTVEAVIQVAPGTGIVTSFVLQSDDLDEVDWEWLGGDTTQVQTNYFSKGDTSTYDRGGTSPVSNPQSEFHTYTLDWSPEALTWSIDGTVVRTLTYNDAKGGATYPQTPMQIKLGTWDAGGASQPDGTAEWAGGRTPFGPGSGAPYVAYYKSIKVTDRSNGVSGASSYTYTDASGTYSSIKVNTGGSTSGDSNSTETTTSKTATKASTTSTSAKASTTSTSTKESTTSTSTKESTTKPHTTATTLVPTTAVGSGNKTTTATTHSQTSPTPSATTVNTNGVAKVAVNVFGAAAAMVAAFALL
ncbi:extracellular cell wall glucanase [Sporothrix brasiliensis 5110]|uniref:Crh-like protein n=1 Tax=Sporothrix brasiliensis 5110 TaxID=1398154 RepID=A0A0C2EUU9_9PEZI|nr:extracellular cell wall glucanase [Sporothrix brasiliensis 5110]KIH90339.1 extracellular cell wall glucanase [Sporothrix brasiliensis 5110]